MGTNKMEFDFNQAICGLIHKFSRSINLFSKAFGLGSNRVDKILVNIYLLWPKL